MMHHSRILIFPFVFAILSFIGADLCAQDVITTIEGEELEVIVDEVGDEVVTYYKYGVADEETYSIKRSRIYRITFESGQEVEFGNQLSQKGSEKVDKETFVRTRKRMIGITPFSLIVGRVNVYYEHGFKDSNNTLYFRGVVDDVYNTDLVVNSGYGLGIGYKIYTSDNQRSILSGFYILPELMVGHINGMASEYTGPGELISSSGKEYKVNSMYFAAIAKLGVQLQLGSIVGISFELFGGYNSLFNSHESDDSKELRIDLMESFTTSILNGVQFNFAVGF